MPYITREDGERFIIPSYRDILSAKKANLLKREIMMLSANYGEYITFQKKNAEQYEIAFSPDSGYLLGECVWHYFKRPFDMIYCEAIPNTTDAVLVIVKSGSVYLDGSFPIDTIPEELVIFKSQQNNFSIHIYGDVPISEKPEEGKISFDADQIRSFEVLSEPVFPTLPGVKAFQLQLVETVLKANGIGTLPIKPIAITVLVVLFLFMGYSLLSNNGEQSPTTFLAPSNPYENYTTMMSVPDAGAELHEIYTKINELNSMPGWTLDSIEFASDTLNAAVVSGGSRMKVLIDWAKQKSYKVNVLTKGVYVIIPIKLSNRSNINTISNYQEVIASLLDSLSYVLPGNVMTVDETEDKKVYMDGDVKINITNITPATIDMISQIFYKLPLILTKVELKSIHGSLSGSITLKAVGN